MLFIKILRPLLLLIALLFYNDSRAQLDFYKTRDYRKADSIAAATRMAKGEKYVAVARRLTANLPTEEEKFRAIFRWVCEHLDYAEGNHTTNPGQLLKYGKAVCIGYATLLKEMCTEAGLECEIITGRARNEPEDIGKRLKKLELHAWNAIKLGGNWYITDATWASGYFDKKTKKFTHVFKETYFIGNPEYFSRNHFPEEKKWQLQDKKVSRYKFVHRPIVWSGYDSLKLTGVAGRAKRFTFVALPLKLGVKQKTATEIKPVAFSYDPETSAYGPVVTSKPDGNTKIRLPMFKRGRRYITLFVNHKPVATYKVRVWGKDPDKIEARREEREKKHERRQKKRNK